MVLLVIYVAIISTNLRIIEKFPLSCSPIKYTIRAKNTVQTSGKKHINYFRSKRLIRWFSFIMSRYESLAQKTVWLSKIVISKQYCLWRLTVTLKHPGATNYWDDVTSVKFNSKKSNQEPGYEYPGSFLRSLLSAGTEGAQKNAWVRGWKKSTNIKFSTGKIYHDFFISDISRSIESLQICQSPDRQYKEEHPIEYKRI